MFIIKQLTSYILIDNSNIVTQGKVSMLLSSKSLVSFLFTNYGLHHEKF